MQTAVMLRKLNTSDSRLPVEALRAADADRESVIPAFLQEIEAYLSGDPGSSERADALFFIFHLLGSWREKSAYRPLVSLLRCKPEVIDRIFGDGIVETSHRVIAAVFDGDPGPLYEIILDPAADEYVRSCMCEALAMVAVRGELPRDQAQQFLLACFDNLKPERGSFVWYGWQKAIAALGLEELRPVVTEAFARGSVERSWMGFHHFEEDLARAIERPGAPWPPEDKNTLFGDTIAELSTWYCFSPEFREDQERRRKAAAIREAVTAPVTNPFKSLGRNDPCHCGSGKKFKKCCLGAAAPGEAANRWPPIAA